MTPFLNPFEFQRHSLEAAADFLNKTAAAPEQTEKIAEAEVGQTPSRTVYSENKLSLLHYEPLTDEQHDVPILITFALINRPYILDLQPDRSVVRRLLEAGFDVYLIDWDEPSLMDGSLGLEDYVLRYMDNCVDVVCDRSGQDAINLFGYCMGGTMSAMYASLFPEKVRTLTLLAAGVCFQGDGGVLELWGSEEYYSPDTMAETFGTIPASFFDLGFALMDPVQNNITKYAYLYDNLEDDDFVENFARMEKWLADGIGMAGRTYEQFLTEIYQGNKLYRNELYLEDRHVDIRNLTMPVLQIVGEYDHLIPPESSIPFNDVIPSEDTTVLRNNSGHIGLSVSSKAHRELWPQAAEWLHDHSVPTPPIARFQQIEGIGPTYAERIVEAGIATFEELVTADPSGLADEIGVSPSRIQTWQQTAREYTA